jgi:hypothetical protein
MMKQRTQDSNTKLSWTLGALIAMWLFMPALCRGENCPWLNAATAGGFLGGEVTMEVTRPAPSDVTCKFVLKTESSRAELEIMVHTMTTIGDEFPQFLAQCGSDSTPLRAIGNQAIECATGEDTNETTEQIVSRVRERAFVLKWTMPKMDGGSASPSKTDVQDKFRNIAEMVAGSLF